jgi:hypothetical protein
MAIAWLGNKAPLELDKSGNPLTGNLITKMGNIHPDDDLAAKMATLVGPDGLWPRASFAPAAWVECDDPELEQALAEHFGCPIGRPDDSWV